MSNGVDRRGCRWRSVWVCICVEVIIRADMCARVCACMSAWLCACGGSVVWGLTCVCSRADMPQSCGRNVGIMPGVRLLPRKLGSLQSNERTGLRQTPRCVCIAAVCVDWDSLGTAVSRVSVSILSGLMCPWALFGVRVTAFCAQGTSMSARQSCTSVYALRTSTAVC
jgi:hypothetical protein